MLRDRIAVDFEHPAVDAFRIVLDRAGSQAPEDDRVWLGWANLAIRWLHLIAGIAHRALHVDVIDHGTGMPPEILARVGEPFFTTKPPGRGMGLGLFLARAVIERLGGSLDVESRTQSGTQVRVIIPAEIGDGVVTAVGRGQGPG